MKTTTVYLNDTAMTRPAAERYFLAAHEWALDNCTGYLNCHVEDVSDFSYLHDLVAQYMFDNEQSAVFFKLKWA